MKEKLYNISRILLWLLLLINLIAFLAFTSKKQSSLTFAGCEVTVEEDPEHIAFVNSISLKQELLDSLKLLSFENHCISDFPPAKIERILMANPFIKKAAVYTDVPGNLYIQVKQKRPIGRVLTEHFDYYITEEGSKMPRNSLYTARVPVITGDFYEGSEYKDSMITEKGKEIFTFLRAIDSSIFYKAFCDQLFYSDGNSDLKMIPKLGNNVIIFGDVSDLSDKLNRLRVFYSKVLNSGTLYKYKSINLKFKNQVVCEMRETGVSTDTSNEHER